MKIPVTLIALAIVSTPVLAEKMTPGNMPAYCRGQAASDFNTKPVYIKTGKLVKAKDGSYSIAGTYDGKDPFTCTYDRNGEFIAMTRGSAKPAGKTKTAGPSAKAIAACDLFMKGEKSHLEGFNDLGNGMFSVTLKYKSGYKHCEVSNEPRVDKFEDL
ncbi:MAG: hypothetical protein IPL11_10360 [Candidatus Accumulibacter sp.]|nr:hypothetical protein [Accumulibacter sp.]